MIETEKQLDKAFYEITLRGTLNPLWEALFDGMTVQSDDNVTKISGVADQAALHGMLAKVRDFGLVLVSVKSEV